MSSAREPSSSVRWIGVVRHRYRMAVRLTPTGHRVMVVRRRQAEGWRGM